MALVLHLRRSPSEFVKMIHMCLLSAQMPDLTAFLGKIITCAIKISFWQLPCAAAHWLHDFLQDLNI